MANLSCYSLLVFESDILMSEVMDKKEEGFAFQSKRRSSKELVSRDRARLFGGLAHQNFLLAHQHFLLLLVMWPFTSSQGSIPQATVPPGGQPNAVASGSGEAPATCPVDHSTRAAWTSANALKAAPAPAPSAPSDPAPATSSSPSLSTSRETSTIPRWSDTEGDQGPWVYPSPAQFYNAMSRKNQSPQARDMDIVVPIHNAVNERAWAQILQWEQGWDAQSKERCGGPKLVSFKGRPKEMTWRAWWKGLAG